MIETLKKQLEGLRFTSGSSPLDQILPGGGFRRGSLVEWFSQQTTWDATLAAGGGMLAWQAAVAACQTGGLLAIIDTPIASSRKSMAQEHTQASRSLHTTSSSYTLHFYPPTLTGWGVTPEQVLVVRPAREDSIWCLDQILRSSAVFRGMVSGGILITPRLPSFTTFRRIEPCVG